MTTPNPRDNQPQLDITSPVKVAAAGPGKNYLREKLRTQLDDATRSPDNRLATARNMAARVTLSRYSRHSAQMIFGDGELRPATHPLRRLLLRRTLPPKPRSGPRP